MIRILTATAVIAASTVSFATFAQAQDSTFYATPMNDGPPKMGMMMGEPASAPMAAPMADKPMMMKKKSMKKHMTKKQMMMMKKDG